MPFKIAPQRIKYPEINLMKDVKDLYCKNFKIMAKEIEDNTNGKLCHAYGLKEYH